MNASECDFSIEFTFRCDTYAFMDTIEKVRTLVGNGLMTRAGLARAAGLHANTLRDCTEDGWNPTTDTLNKLAAFLEAKCGHPIAGTRIAPVPVKKGIAQ